MPLPSSPCSHSRPNAATACSKASGRCGRVGAYTLAARRSSSCARSTISASADAASVAYVNARLETGDFGHDPLPSDEPPADVVVANILLNPLLALQDTITGLVKVGGTQVMSGIRLDQADRVIAAYGPKFDDVRVAKETDGWLVVVASGRKAD